GHGRASAPIGWHGREPQRINEEQSMNNAPDLYGVGIGIAVVVFVVYLALIAFMLWLTYLIIRAAVTSRIMRAAERGAIRSLAARQYPAPPSMGAGPGHPEPGQPGGPRGPGGSSYPG